MKEELEELLSRLKSAFNQSEVKNHKFLVDSKRIWNYELIISALRKNKPLLIGFNWGVDNSWNDYINGDEYLPQTKIEERHFLQIYKGSMKRVIGFINRYFPDHPLEQASHSNFCFFRSEKENQISDNDIILCIPIFEDLIKIVQPSIIFCFSSKARDHLISSNLLEDVKHKKLSLNTPNSNNFTVAKGKLKNGVTIYFLPHPNYSIKKELREEAWRFCSESI